MRQAVSADPTPVGRAKTPGSWVATARGPLTRTGSPADHTSQRYPFQRKQPVPCAGSTPQRVRSLGRRQRVPIPATRQPAAACCTDPVLSATSVIHRVPVDETCVTVTAATADARFVASQSTETCVRPAGEPHRAWSGRATQVSSPHRQQLGVGRVLRGAPARSVQDKPIALNHLRSYHLAPDGTQRRYREQMPAEGSRGARHVRSRTRGHTGRSGRRAEDDRLLQFERERPRRQRRRD